MRIADDSDRCKTRIAAILALLLTLTPVMLSHTPADSATLQVVVRDSSGKAVVDAMVYVQSKGTTNAAQAVTAHTDANGDCSFSHLGSGVYAVRVEKTGYAASTLPALSLTMKETKNVSVTLNPEKSGAPAAPAFFDDPHFTVSGVTDTTSMGGHGSDAVARTRESLAKDTLALGETGAAPASAESASEVALREVEVALQEKVQREPTSFAANRDLGKLLLAEGKPREAVNYFERAEDAAHDQLRPDQAELHHLLARAQEQLGDPLDAVRDYQRAAELDPNESNLFDWGSELLLHHAPEPAMEVFGKGNRLFPQSRRMLMGLGATWFANGLFDRAVESICQASDLNPADPVPYRFLAMVQSTQTLTSEKLVQRLRRFASLHPENAAANYYLAVGLWKLHENSPDPQIVRQVNSLLQTALHLEPNFGAAYLQLGILHAERKDFSQAVTDYQQALYADSAVSDSTKVDFRMTTLEIEETHYRLAQAYRETGQTDRAKAELQLYEQILKESAQQVAQQRREMGQFVYSLRDQNSASH
jgi:tetratricopeptide (TPR) repeat protein